MDCDGILANLLETIKAEDKGKREVKIYSRGHKEPNIVQVKSVPEKRIKTCIKNEEIHKTKPNRLRVVKLKIKRSKGKEHKNRKVGNSSNIVTRSREEILASQRRCVGGFAEGCRCTTSSDITYATKRKKRK